MQDMGLAMAIALFGALGNGLFAYSQRKSALETAPYAFLTLLVATCLVLNLITVLVIFRGLRPPDLGSLAYRNIGWAIGGGLGLYMTLTGFHFLFTRFGTTYYALYSVLAILTTTLFVGQVLLREPINGFHLAAIILAIGTVILFTLGQSRVSA